MAFQKLLARFAVSAFICSFALQTLVLQKVSTLVFPLVFLTLFFLHVSVAILYVVFIHPRVSSLRHLPTARQPPLRLRFVHEPNARQFEQWINEVPNDGLIRYFGFFNMERVLLASSSAVREVLSVNSASFEKQYAQRTHLERVSGKGLVVQEGSIHKHQRRAMESAFRWSLIKADFTSLFWKKTDEMLTLIEQETRKSPLPAPAPTEHQRICGSITLDDIVNRTVFDIIGQLSYGVDFQSIAQPQALFRPLIGFREAFLPSPSNRLRVLLAFVLPSWVVNALPIRFNRTTAVGINQFRKIGIDYIARKQLEKKTGDAEPKTSFPALMETMMKAEKLSEVELLEQFAMLQAVGIHSTAAAFMSAVWFLAQAQHANVQEQLRNEVRRELPSPGSAPISLEGLGKCTFLKAVINEVLRLHPAFSWFGRTPTHRQVVCGTVLPAALSISLSPWALHRNTSTWGSDALEFKPERWLQDTQHSTIPKDGFEWLAFGAGPRKCIGERVVRRELECMLAGVFGRFELRFAQGQSLPRTTHQMTLAFREELKVQSIQIEGW